MKRETSAQDPCQYIEGLSKSSDSRPHKLIRLFQSSLFTDLLSCILLAAGLGAAALTLTDFEGGFWTCFAFAFASTLVIAVFALRWWVAPATAVALLSATALYCGLTGRLEATASFWLGFFAWILQGAPSDNAAYSESSGAVILKAAIIFVIALTCFVLIRKLFFLPAIFLFLCAGFAAVYCLEHSDLSVPLCVCAGGMIILLPRAYSRYVSSRGGGGEMRGAMQMVAVPAAVLAMLLALLLIPEDTSPWKSRGINNLISDIAYMLEGPFGSYPSNASGFSMQRLGFGQESGRLGGPVTLTDEKYLSVDTDRPVLLRGAVMDHYTGESWQPGGPDGDFRFDSLFWRGYRSNAFGLNKPLGSEARKLFEELTTEQEWTVGYYGDRFNTVFAGGILRDVRFKSENIVEPIYFNMRSELYRHYLIPALAKLQLKTRVWNTGAPGFEESFLRLEELAANRDDKNFSGIRQRYTRLPDTLPESVGELAAEITAESVSPYQKATAIKRWLAENCEYTLEPAVPPEDSDFVGYFLETGEGYCTYYASAMAVLARCAGLPSRYVTGFGLEWDEKTELFFATGKTAHAWTEIYFDGIGWIEFDPLDWDPAAPLNREQAGVSDSQTRPVSTPPQGSADNGISDEGSGMDGRTRDPMGPRQVLSSLAALAALYVIVRLAVYRIMSRKVRIYELSRVSRKVPDWAKRMDLYFDDILRQLSLLGIDIRPGETLTEFSARVDRRLRFEDKSFAPVARIQMRMHFAEVMPGLEDCETAFRYHRELEALLRERLSKTMYFFKRAIRR